MEALLRKLIVHEEYEAKAARLARFMGMRAADLAELLRLGRVIEEVIGRG